MCDDKTMFLLFVYEYEASTHIVKKFNFSIILSSLCNDEYAKGFYKSLTRLNTPVMTRGYFPVVTNFK